MYVSNSRRSIHPCHHATLLTGFSYTCLPRYGPHRHDGTRGGRQLGGCCPGWRPQDANLAVPMRAAACCMRPALPSRMRALPRGRVPGTRRGGRRLPGFPSTPPPGSPLTHSGQQAMGRPSMGGNVRPVTRGGGSAALPWRLRPSARRARASCDTATGGRRLPPWGVSPARLGGRWRAPGRAPPRPSPGTRAGTRTTAPAPSPRLPRGGARRSSSRLVVPGCRCGLRRW